MPLVLYRIVILRISFIGGIFAVKLQHYHESSVILRIFQFFWNNYLAKLCAAASAFTQSYVSPWHRAGPCYMGP